MKKILLGGPEKDGDARNRPGRLGAAAAARPSGPGRGKKQLMGRGAVCGGRLFKKSLTNKSNPRKGFAGHSAGTRHQVEVENLESLKRSFINSTYLELL